MINQNEILEKIRRKNEKIIKRGTYIIEAEQLACEAPVMFEDETFVDPVECEEAYEGENDDLVNEILARFKNNIQDNVSALFENN